MPELPEVEVTRQSFATRIEGASIQDVYLSESIGKPLRFGFSRGGVLPQALLGKVVLGVRRRGKYLLLDLSTGLLVVHLGMSGRLQFANHLPPRSTHDHFDLVTPKGTLRLHDPRRFGAVIYANDEQDAFIQKLFSTLGVEPLNDTNDGASAAFTPEFFHTALATKSAPIKQVLLSGLPVVGVGNIYASEALFHAGIRPQTAAKRLSKTRAARLHAAVVQVLVQAVRLGGSTLRDFANAYGEDGYFQLQAAVYGRAGQACSVCANPIKRLVQGTRATFWCAVCQH